MGALLGLGMTHYPPVSWTDEHMGDIFRLTRAAPNVRDDVKDPRNWPDGALAELADDDGIAAAAADRARLIAGFQACRCALDAFAPDFLIVVGDDQYENFKEDIIPPFCVLGLDASFEVQPWREGVGAMAPNVWAEPPDHRMPIRGHREGAKAIATGLIERGIDVPYAYKTLHYDGLAHAFTNTLMYLDYDRTGMDYPVVPFLVNCYGSAVIAAKGGFAHLTQDIVQEGAPDPRAPQPWRCMVVGAALARTIEASPWRVALIGSSSWSHAFLASKTGYLFPDRDADRVLYEALKRGDYDTWRDRSLADMEASGQHEMLNWYVLVGAMEALGRTPVIHDYIESWVLTSNKCFAEFPA